LPRDRLKKRGLADTCSTEYVHVKKAIVLSNSKRPVRKSPVCLCNV
jgi:hypothetical protein